MKQFVFILFALAVSLAAIAPAQTESPLTREGRYWVRTINGSVASVAVEHFRLDTVGNVLLQGAADGTIVYKLKVRVRARDPREAEAFLHEFDVKTRTQSGWLRFNVNVPAQMSEGPELQISVPRGLRQVWIDTHGGNVQVLNLDGDVEARSAAGRMEVDGVKGRAGIRTGGGDIQVGTVAGPVQCFSGAGVIRVQSAGGDSWFETAGGEIQVHQVAGPVHAFTAGGNIRIDRASGTVFARTEAGLIEVQQADGAVTAESSGGAIQVNAANGVRCESAGGAIRLRNVAGSLRASTAVGSILAELLSGNRIQDSTLSTHSGDITVFISSNLPLTVLARNESAGAAGRIISDFPEIQPRGGQPGYNPVVAQGALNGGGPVLRISAAGGTIYLRRQK
jgi:hypothetical protein